MTADANDDELLRDLGLLTVRAAKLEEELRDAFCHLVGSKYSVVVAGGQPVTWLIDQCQALVRANLEIPDDKKAAMMAALEECRAANEQRNILIHSVKSGGFPDGEVVTARSRRGTFEPSVQRWTAQAIREAVSRISAARFALHDAVGDAISHEVRMIRYELFEETQPKHHPDQSR